MTGDQYHTTISRGRLALYWFILVCFVLLFIPVLTLAYYTYAKVTFPAFSCGSFAQPDPVLGWWLKPDAKSCLGGRASPFSAPVYEAAVFTDNNGFRAATPGTNSASDAVMFVGDSWTFGYGVTYAQSFPGQYSAAVNKPVVVAASPAYSSAQSLLLAERWIGKLTPRAIVYFDVGMWERAACSGSSRPTAILKPCYWQAPRASTAELVLPPPGRVERAAAWGILPGGMVGAGEMTWAYFLIARPVAQVYGLLVKAGLVSGLKNDFYAQGVDPDVMKAAAFKQIVDLAKQADVPFLLVDPAGLWPALHAKLPPEDQNRIRYISGQQWNAAVVVPSQQLPETERRVPTDGHFGPGTNRLAAKLIAEQLP